MIVVRSEDGTFLGEVGRFSVNERDHYNEEKGCYCTFVITADHGTEGGCDLAEYKTKEAAIEQMNCIQNILEWGPGKLKLENLKAYEGLETTQVLVPVYDLRECKIHED